MDQQSSTNGPVNAKYNPFTQKQWEMIKLNWDIYKRDVGLEGELFLNLKKAEIGENEILETINQFRRDRQIVLESWRDLRK
jgi:hypothetical protein